MTSEDQPMLPGLEITNHESLEKPSSMRLAVVQNINALREADLLEPRHVGLCQLALELADAVVAGRRAGRASAVAMASRELRETLLSLPAPEDKAAGDAFNAWVEATLNKRDHPKPEEQ